MTTRLLCGHRFSWSDWICRSMLSWSHLKLYTPHPKSIVPKSTTLVSRWSYSGHACSFCLRVTHLEGFGDRQNAAAALIACRGVVALRGDYVLEIVSRNFSMPQPKPIVWFFPVSKKKQKKQLTSGIRCDPTSAFFSFSSGTKK